MAARNQNRVILYFILLGNYSESISTLLKAMVVGGTLRLDNKRFQNAFELIFHLIFVGWLVCPCSNIHGSTPMVFKL